MDATTVEPDPDRAERLLRAMHKVLSHDLPNHLVVVQSLIQLLDLEERAHLGAQGQDYLTRLAGAALRTQHLAKYLKDLERLNTLAEKPEPLALAPLLAEVRADLAQATPALAVTWIHRLPVTAVNVGRRCFQRCLTELVRLSADLFQTSALEGRVTLVNQGGSTLFQINFAPAGTSDLPQASWQRNDKMVLVQRLDFLLARALAATWHGDLEADLTAETLSASLTIPAPHV